MLALVIGGEAARSKVVPRLRACGYTVLWRAVPAARHELRVLLGPIHSAAHFAHTVDQLVGLRVQVTVLASDEELWRYAAAQPRVPSQLARLEFDAVRWPKSNAD